MAPMVPPKYVPGSADGTEHTVSVSVNAQWYMIVQQAERLATKQSRAYHASLVLHWYRGCALAAAECHMSATIVFPAPKPLY